MADSEDPFTATMIGLTAVGTGISAMSAIRQGQVGGDTAMMNAKLRSRELISQAQMAEREAQEAEFGAEAEREATGFEVARQKEQAGVFQSQQRADIAGSGLEATGSPLLVMSETARQLELDRLAIEHAGEIRARQFEDEARLSKYQAGELRKGIPLTMDIGRYQSRAARQAGQLGAVSSLISGGARGLSIYGNLQG